MKTTNLQDFLRASVVFQNNDSQPNLNNRWLDEAPWNKVCPPPWISPDTHPKTVGDPYAVDQILEYMRQNPPVEVDYPHYPMWWEIYNPVTKTSRHDSDVWWQWAIEKLVGLTYMKDYLILSGCERIRTEVVTEDDRDHCAYVVKVAHAMRFIVERQGRATRQELDSVLQYFSTIV
jgi:hypothetical protein